MTDAIKSEIEKYVGGVRKAQTWIAEREEQSGIVGMDPFDEAYPSKIFAARRRIAEFEAVLIGLRAQARETSPATDTKRTASSPTTDVDRAMSIVVAAMKACIPSGAPLPFRRIVDATPVKGRFGLGAEAELEMFDSLTARYDCGRYGPEPDAWTSIWSRLDGGAIAYRDGAWKRVEDSAVVEPDPPPVTAIVQIAGHIRTLDGCLDKIEDALDRGGLSSEEIDHLGACLAAAELPDAPGLALQLHNQ